MTEQNDDGEPLLVRPYILGAAEVPAPRPSAETWPDTATGPAAGATGTPPPPPAPGARPEVAPEEPSSRRWLLVLAASIVLLIAGAGGLFLALRPHTPAPRALPTDFPPPVVVTTTATRSAAADPPAAAGPTTTPGTRTTSTPATTSPTATTAPATTAPAPRSSTTTRPFRSPTAALVPAADRVGRIGAAGGLCLDLNGGVAFDDNHVQVYGCNGSPAQVWTLAADGTLRVVGKCAQVVADQTVHITGCDTRVGSQWRTGRDGTLVNVLTGTCLTDPAGGSRAGTGVRVDACSGAAGQRWQLP